MESNMSTINSEIMSVIDPQNRSGKIQIPLAFVFETKGKSEALRQSRNQKDLSLCLLFQNGRCNVGAKCHQIHADCEFVRKLRVAATQCTTCCAAHGDPQSKDIASVERTVLVTSHTSPHVPLPVHSFAATTLLSQLLTGRGAMTVSLQRVCRLHQQNRCKYGRDCRHVHMCREAYAKLSAALPTKAAPLPLCADLIETSSHTSSDALSGDSLCVEPTTTLLDAYLKGWTPASTCAGHPFSSPSPLFTNMRSPLDLRNLCTDILGA